MEHFTVGLLSVVVISEWNIFAGAYNVEVDKVSIARGEAGSQFGYTVALVPAPEWINNTQNNSSGNDKVLLVGAPNQTYMGTRGHGQIYICSNIIHEKISDCWSLNVSDTEVCEKIRRYNKNRTVCEKDSRLGSTMEVNKNYPNIWNTTQNETIPMVLVCAPRWKNSFFETITTRNHMYGMCIKLTTQLEQINCSKDGKLGCWPFTKSYDDKDKTGIALFQYAESGMSVAFTKDGYEIIGAPGVDNWKGAFRSTKKHWTVRLSQSSPHTEYFGYALKTGNFMFNVSILSGVPNYYVATKQGHSGQVVLYNGETEKGSIDYGVLYNCSFLGEQILEADYFDKVIQTNQGGTKFGAALETVDLTGDGFDEVLVGAPMYSGANPDEGRVFVYTFTKQRLCGPIGVFSGGAHHQSLRHKTSFARFGSSIASIGDLDKDEFNDVAIGAPYEDGGTGAVYIYNGQRSIFRDKFSQRIAGKRVNPGIQSFGWSLYGNADVDGNNFPDIAVGAYTSDTVAILRTRPVVRLDIQMNISPSPIPLNSSLLNCSSDIKTLCFYVNVHFRYDSVGSKTDVSKVSLLWAMEADTIYKIREGASRVMFSETNTSTFAGNITLDEGNPTIRDFQLIVKGNPEPKDIWTKVRIEGNWTLQKSSEFDVLDPKVVRNTTSFIFKDVEFDRKCKSLESCTSDLEVSVDMFVIGMERDKKIENETEIFVGEASQLMIVVEMRSLADIAHNAMLSSKVSLAMQQQFESRGIVDASCETGEDVNSLGHSNVICTANNILYGKRNVKMKFYYDVSSAILLPNNDVESMKNDIKVEVEAKQENLDVNQNNNIFVRHIDVKLKYKIEIENDNTDAGQIVYKPDVASRRVFKVFHRFYITNKGPSYLPLTYVHIAVPVKSGHRDTSIAVLQNITAPCSISERKPASQTRIITSNFKQDLSQVVWPAEDFEDINGEETELVKYIACLDEKYECAIIKCKLANMEQSTQEIVEFSVDVYEKELATEKTGDVNVIKFESLAIVTDPHVFYGKKSLAWNKQVFSKKSTSFVPELETPKINIWIIISSGVAGFALLCILIIIMWKCKFFDRKSHDEVLQWRDRRGEVQTDKIVLSADFNQSADLQGSEK